MFAEYDRVRIKGKNVIGDIVDVKTTLNGTKVYMVESDQEGPSDDADAWNLRYPIFTCTEEELEPIL